jgi:hypothetical protein
MRRELILVVAREYLRKNAKAIPQGPFESSGRTEALFRSRELMSELPPTASLRRVTSSDPQKHRSEDRPLQEHTAQPCPDDSF